MLLTSSIKLVVLSSFAGAGTFKCLFLFPLRIGVKVPAASLFAVKSKSIKEVLTFVWSLRLSAYCISDHLTDSFFIYWSTNDIFVSGLLSFIWNKSKFCWSLSWFFNLPGFKLKLALVFKNPPFGLNDELMIFWNIFTWSSSTSFSFSVFVYYFWYYYSSLLPFPLSIDCYLFAKCERWDWRWLVRYDDWSRCTLCDLSCLVSSLE